MNLFDDEPTRMARAGADWENHRKHRVPASGPPQDEVGVLALSSFLLARTDEVVVSIRGITSYSDGLVLSLAVLFSDEQKVEDLSFALRDFGRSPGRFRFGVVFADGRSATSGTRDAPAVRVEDGTPALIMLAATPGTLIWDGGYWLHPLPPPGPFVIGCRWPDRGIAETLVEIDPAPLLVAATQSVPVWGSPP